jgi:hypothetical protein
MKATVYAIDGDTQAVVNEGLNAAIDVVSNKTTEQITKPIKDIVGESAGKMAEPLIDRFINWIFE